MKGLKNLLAYSCLFGSCLTLGLTSCDDDENGTDSQQKGQQTKVFSKADVSSEKMQSMTSGYNQFVWRFFESVSESSEEKDKNYFLSPLSLSVDFAMLQNGAKGESQTQINKAIGLEGYSTEEANGYFYNLTKRLSSVDDVQFNLANAVFYNTGRGVCLDSTFSYFLTNTYDACVKGGDYADVKLADEVNKWCSDQTNGKITKVIEGLNAQNGLIDLLNAVYLKADWTQKFDRNELSTDTFETSIGGFVLSQYMVDERELAYSENNQLQYSEISLAGGDYAVFFVLPKEGKTISETAAYLKTNWNSVLPSSEKRIFIYIPVFDVKYELNGEEMKSALKSLGMTNVFNPEKADIAGCFDLNKTTLANPFVGNVLQKTSISLSQGGVEASAVTVISAMDSAIMFDGPEMRLTRPFIYGIRDTKTGVILFTGCMNNPMAK
ncbi:MAG: serpin family protein [Paludibacteraceae bacterium]